MVINLLHFKTKSIRNFSITNALAFFPSFVPYGPSSNSFIAKQNYVLHQLVCVVIKITINLYNTANIHALFLTKKGRVYHYNENGKHK